MQQDMKVYRDRGDGVSTNFIPYHDENHTTSSYDKIPETPQESFYHVAALTSPRDVSDVVVIPSKRK